jgi:hypothetical protein
MDTHVSELQVENMEPRSLEERISFPCPRAKEVGCTKTFSTKGNAEKHAKSAHDEIRHPCPRAKEVGCTMTFSTPDNAKRHAKRAHGDVNTRYPCPYAKDLNCDMTFSTPDNAKQHAMVVHENAKYACPVEGCASTFGRKSDLEKHIKRTHGDRKGIACPRGDEVGCLRVFCSKRAASQHAKAVHDKAKDVPCPFAEEKGCLEKFMSKGEAKIHADSVHLDEPTYPCPRAQEENCDKMFRRPSSARLHAKRKHGKVEAEKTFIAAWPKILPHIPLLDATGKQIPGWDKLPEPPVLDNRFACPHPGCNTTNPDIGQIRYHYLSKHMGARWPCKYVETLGCDKTFSSRGRAQDHANWHFPPKYWFICQFDRCLVHVQGRKLAWGASRTHYKMHVRRGHFQDGECLPLKVRNNERTNEHHLMGTIGLQFTLWWSRG